MDPQNTLQARAAAGSPCPSNRPSTIPRLQAATESLQRRLTHLLHIESFSGMVLMIAAAAALIWANSPWAAS